nr:YihY/virulence factor BrkB family protein [Gemmatimonadales bacterium]
VPLFLWFATRLFASVRTALTLVYDVPRRATGQHFVLGFLAGKLRDAVMVLFTLALLVGNATLTTGLRVLNTRGQDLIARWPGLGLLVGSIGRSVSEVVAFVFSAALFYVVYRHASPRRLPRRAALAGSLFTALLFEVAKRFYGWYLHNLAVADRFSADANLGAVILFILWLYYTGVVFLLGAVVAETFDLLGRQRASHARPVVAGGG